MLKNSEDLTRNDLDPDLFFSVRIHICTKIKWILSTAIYKIKISTNQRIGDKMYFSNEEKISIFHPHKLIHLNNEMND